MDHTAPAPRRRVRAARSTLARIARQRDEFATAYSQALTPQQRFNAAATALRSVIAARKNRRPAEAERQLEEITAQITRLLDALHASQQHDAERALRAEARRIARNQRRNDDDRVDHPAA